MSAQLEQLSAVDLHAPWAGAEERALRVRIHRARDVATARAMRERNSRARELYWVAASVAHDWVFRRVDELDTLERILRCLAQIFLAADNIVQVEEPDAE